MMSEATTMALADMLLIDALAKSNVEYNFDKRRIYPLFRDLHLDLSDADTRIDNLKRVIRANYKYCLLGDDSVYVQMLAQGQDTCKGRQKGRGSQGDCRCECVGDGG